MPDTYSISIQIDPSFRKLTDAGRLVDRAKSALTHQNIPHGSLSIVLTDDQAVQELNRTFRAIDAPTDVLSFPNHVEPASGYDEQPDEQHDEQCGESSFVLTPTPSPTSMELILPEEMAEGEADYLGDIIIAVPYTQQQAQRLGRSLSDELDLLVVHGVLHLLGYDHATPTDETEMWSIQGKILGSL